MMSWGRNFVEERAAYPRLLSFSRRAQEKKKAELAGREYDRVLLLSMANARFRRYLLVDELALTSRSRAA